MPGDPIVNKLNELENESYRIGSNLTKIINHRKVDARILIFYNLAQLIRSTKLYFILKSEYLNSKEWFVDIYLKKWGQSWPYASNNSIGMIFNDNTEIINDYDQVIIVGYIQCLFSIVESRFRIFTSCLDPKACLNGTANFESIYQWLLNKLGKQKQYLEVLNFSRLVRNTIHNNGVYMNIKAPVKQVTYKEKIYTFEHGKPPIFNNLINLLFFDLTPNLMKMMEDIIRSPSIIELDYIEDPISK